jgi:diguanylate cyclase (GGDEF)-like protein
MLARRRRFKFALRAPKSVLMEDRWHRGSRLLAAVVASMLVPAFAAAPVPAASAAARLAEIEASLRGRPEQALPALAAALDGANGPERVELLVLRGQLQSRLADGPAVEKTAQALEQLGASTQTSAAPAAAGLVRARWLTRRGPLGHADRMLGDAYALLPAGATPGLRLRFLEAQAKIRQSLGRLDDAVRLYQQAVALADGAGPLWRRAEQRSALAYTLYLAQQPDRALEVNREALALARSADDALAQSQAMTVEAIVAGAQGRKEEELQAMRMAIDLARRAGAKLDTVLGLANLSDHYLKAGDYVTALALAREALPLAHELQDPASETVALTNAGLALIALGHLDEGMGLVGQALSLCDRAGGLTDMADIQQELGLTLEKAGQLERAWPALLAYRRLADEVFQRGQQQAVTELQEDYEAERRRREVALLQTEMGLKEALLLGRELQQRLWAVAATAGVLLLAVVGLLVRRMRRSNAELAASNSQLKVASQCDALTGLANRRHFTQVMQALSPRETGGALEGSLLLIDIDHFKRINDRHGHVAGDAVLMELAQRLRAAMRGQDLTVRWGGEEFLVLVRSLPAAQVEALAERLLAAIAGEPVHHGRERIAVTASIGFATFPLQPQCLPVTWECAIDLVDTAMYLAKAHGRNRAYGVRALHDDARGQAAGGGLESAWRNGRADLKLLAGPAVAPVAP